MLQVSFHDVIKDFFELVTFLFTPRSFKAPIDHVLTPEIVREKIATDIFGSHKFLINYNIPPSTKIVQKQIDGYLKL